ncbi:MAG TPA: Uma2 family endonuclease [Verrucomicrobiae bacterium]|nr:Uma2 family endonuclease [Verrucomicrobiae bacterium]
MTVAEFTKPKAKARRLWTYAEMVAELPETNLPVELWNGEIIRSPAPHPDHQTIVLNFAATLREFVAVGRSGKVFVSPVDVVLTPRRVVQPDVLFIEKTRLNIVGSHVAGAPDLVMEVISAGSWQRDRIEKMALYEQAGVAEYWIIDPDAAAIEVFALVKGVYQLHSKATGKESARSKLLPGFKTNFLELMA